MKESVRSGRKANFYITENSFIDNYARLAEPAGIAVYHVLERYMNSETKATWVGTAKIAEVLGMSQRHVQRSLKKLEELKLIRILRTATLTTYVVMPVPMRPKAAMIPLFDKIDGEEFYSGDMSVVEATSTSRSATSATPRTTTTSRQDDTAVALYKEEQELENNTQEQESEGHKNPASSKASSLATAERVLTILGLPATSSNLTRVEAAIAAEAAYTGQPPEEAGRIITRAAMEDRERGIHIDKFYFEDAKWRRERGSNARGNISKAEQRTLNNLEVAERVKQRFRERFGKG